MDRGIIVGELIGVCAASRSGVNKVRGSGHACKLGEAPCTFFLTGEAVRQDLGDDGGDSVRSLGGACDNGCAHTGTFVEASDQTGDIAEYFFSVGDNGPAVACRGSSGNSVLIFAIGNEASASLAA
eukprot:TRINITY_DN6159_c0_g3_i1.p2 TRINITY_DN6159_c0_g3~~TRINITY_DN6159_c0_g3_i1.p2  ORF type:complete len:126 (+),score=8.20 TRINITY_DN6159_c0_g3_i1:983-1360(+)